MEAASERSGDRRPGPPLPAPYRSPWRQLGESLAAVLADLGLGLRRLLRLNRQGELPAPALWPRSLAPLFWPLVLLLALALPVLGGLWLQQRPGMVATPAPLPAATSPAEAEGQAEVEAGIEAAPAEAEADRAGTDQAQNDPIAAAPAEPDRSDPASQALSARPEAADLLAAVTAEPAQSLLRFSLLPAFEALSAAERQAQADRWLAWARELGYEHLELRQGADQLVGREALVGDGMILRNVRPGR